MGNPIETPLVGAVEAASVLAGKLDVAVGIHGSSAFSSVFVGVSHLSAGVAEPVSTSTLLPVFTATVAAPSFAATI